MKRVKYLDELRLFAILNVILLHVLSLFRYLSYDKNIVDFTIWTFFDSLTRVGLPIFFMLTGILMFQKKDEDYFEFIKKRVVRLVLAYFFFSIVYYISGMIINHDKFSLYNFVSLTTSGTIIYHLWFMPVIIIIYMFIPFLKKLVNSLTEKEIRIMIILIFLLGNCIAGFRMLFSNYDIMYSFLLPNIIIYTNYLFIGYYLYKYEIKMDPLFIVLSILSIIGMTITTLIISKTAVEDFFLNSLSPLVVLPSCFVFLLFKKNKDKIIPEWLDNFMLKHNKDIFYVYLIHALIILIIKTIFPSILTNTNLFINVVITIVLFMVVTFISFFLIWLWDKLKELITMKKKNS